MARKPPAPSPARSPAAVHPEDLETARREALLQLRIGRSTHLVAVGVSTALAVEAILLLFFFPTLPTLGAHAHGLAALGRSFYLIVPIAGGVGLAAICLASKWGEFQVWPWEPHFATSVGAVGLAGAVAVVYGLRLGAVSPLASLPVYPWLLPAALAGISLALLGTVLTWTPWGARQWTSAAAAVLPVSTALLVYFPPNTAAGPSEALALALLVSAILYQTSGSFLHLVSSGTGAHEQAVVLAGQNRIVRLADEVRQREEATLYREKALVRREADAESTDAALRRARELHTEREARLTERESAHEALENDLAHREREVAGREAALEGKARAVEERAKEIVLRGEELARQAPELAAREDRLAGREGELARRDLELQHRQEDLSRREATVADGEARLASRRKEIDQKTAELLRREGAVVAQEAPRAAAGTGTGRPAAGAAAQELAAREARVQHLKGLLDEQNAQLGRRSKEVADQARVAEGAQRQVSERQAHLAARESAISQREADLQDRLKVADERRLQFENAAREYQQRLEDAGRQHVASAQKATELDRTSRSLAAREKSVAEREARLRASVEELDRREGAVLVRERAVDATEAEVSLRRQEIARESDLPFAGLLAAAAADRLGGGGRSLAPSSRGRSRPAPAEAGNDGPETTAEGTLTPATGRRYPDRLPTGTPRLDDLLLGGLPPKSHVALVGDAFVGKEIALYSFVAEGLKRSEPAILVTASRSAPEVSESLGTVLPQFREYEQMGRVTWIDASGAGTAGAHRLTAKSSDDRAGILTALVQAAKGVGDGGGAGPFRVGFLGLSAVLAHTDERASFSFLQNVVGILKPRNALAMYSLEAGALSEAQVESLLGRMDGALLFRQDRDRTFLSVKGFGDVATRDWIEVRATNRALTIGSFALERIR